MLKRKSRTKEKIYRKTKKRVSGQDSGSEGRAKRFLRGEGEGNMILDSKNRVTLGKRVIDEIKKITHTQNISSFRMSLTKGGEIVLTAMSTIPANEMWLWKNKKALQNVFQGIQELEEGKGTKMRPDEL